MSSNQNEGYKNVLLNKNVAINYLKSKVLFIQYIDRSSKTVFVHTIQLLIRFNRAKGLYQEI